MVTAGIFAILALSGCGASNSSDHWGTQSTTASYTVDSIPRSVLGRESKRLHAKVMDLLDQGIIVDDWNIADDRLHITLDQHTRGGSVEILKSTIGSIGLDITLGGVGAESG